MTTGVLKARGWITVGKAADVIRFLSRVLLTLRAFKLSNMLLIAAYHFFLPLYVFLELLDEALLTLNDPMHRSK